MIVAIAIVLSLAGAVAAASEVVAPSVQVSGEALEWCLSRYAGGNALQDRLVVEFTVEPDGSAGDVEYPTSAEPWQRRTTECILQRAKLTAGTVDGKPVSAKATLPIRFTRDDIERPQLQSSPAEVEAAYRDCYPVDLLSIQTAQYTLTIGTDGIARNIALAESGGDPALDASGVCVLGKVRFQPARQGGADVEVTIKLPLQIRPPRF